MRPKYEGTTRSVYDLGKISLPGKGNLHLLLKVGTVNEESSWYRYYHCPDTIESKFNNEKPAPYWQMPLYELGSMDIYFDYLTSDSRLLKFPSEKMLEIFCSRTGFFGRELDIGVYNRLAVEPGDVGALPYFQLVVKTNSWYGVLTEGLPCLIKPLNLGHPSDFDHTMSAGRVIDLFPNDNKFSEVTTEYQCDFFGLWERGKKYFLPENRIDL